ncbi:alpha/beta hydrolase [Streptomyces sp. NBC_00457]|uniref:alpha/beta fold hydrolase n=1 Tax=Streptomyces sp. NBC_00457 TaxID=2975748 RepID=UPI002E1E7F77
MTTSSIRERELRVAGIRTVLRESGPADDREAVVFLHGSPGSSADWIGLLDSIGGKCRAVAWDAPGFGRAAKPSDFPHAVEGHAAFIGTALDTLGIDHAHLVVHDFGGPWGLTWAAAHPERFASAVLIDTGVLFGYRWHALARIWRTPVLGELFMATATRPTFRALLRRGNPRGLPREFMDRMYDDFDRRTRRAVLRLYRATDAAAATGPLSAVLRPLRRPALVIWGAHDPYLPVAQAEIQRRTFPDAELVILDESGHWPFMDAPEAVAAAVTKFVQHAAGH